MVRKQDLYNKAVALRRKGFSYNEILEHVSVARSTISRWCSKIPLTRRQIERLLKKKRNTPLIQKRRKQAIQSKKEAKVWAKKYINKLSNKDRRQLLLISGILLYWAEGSSYEKSIQFTNTDSKMIRIMMEFFRKILKVPEDKFRLMVRIGSEGNIKRAEMYWSKITKVSKKNFRPPELLKLNPNGKSLKKHPYGMCRIEVNDISLFRKLIALIREFSKKFALVAQQDRARHS